MARLRHGRKNGVELMLCEQSTVSYPPHNHISVFTLGFVLDGAIELTTERGSRFCQQGDCFLILPYMPHRIDAKARYTLLSLCVRVHQTDGEESLLSDAAELLHGAVGDPETEEKILRALSGVPLLRGMFSGRGDGALGRIRTRLEAHPEREYRVGDMARQVFLSKYDFIRAFKAEVGLTPHRFQLQNRVRKAQRLLEGSATVARAALDAGFCDQSHLTRHFEKWVGVTPAAYKQACDAGTAK